MRRARSRRRGGLVLVLSHARDDHARAVLAALARLRARTLLLDTARFPERARLEAAVGGGRALSAAITDRGERVDLSEVGAAWWRRPRPYVLHRALRGVRREAAFLGCDGALNGLWNALHVLWVNDPVRDEAAEYKVRQLALAQRLGLVLPETLVTNDPGAAREFMLGQRSGAIHKTIESTPATWRTTQIARPDRPLLEMLRHEPVILQERVEAVADVRVTVVGDHLLAAEIDYPRGPHALDWRVAWRRARVRAVKLPRDVEAKLRRLVRELGLVYAAIDLRRRPDGEHVFLEVNPSGQWLFVEERTPHRITSALAALLARGGAAD